MADQDLNSDTPVQSASKTDEYPPDATSSEAQLRLEIKTLRNEVTTQLKQINAILSPPEPGGFDRFCSSGIFFILLGVGLLVAAYVGLAIGVHSSFSFVLVVLGVAILLFGTGTQGMGKLESNTAAARYNVAIAGGAGVLALAIGFGMVKFGPEMQRAFDVETRYVVATLRPNPDGSSSFANYWAEFEIDGVPIPGVHRGEVILAFVPYYDTQKAATKHVSYRLRLQDPRISNANFKPQIFDKFDIPLQKVQLNNSGSDFPVYDEISPVDMRSPNVANAVLQAAASQQLPTAPGKNAPDPTIPANLEVQ